MSPPGRCATAPPAPASGLPLRRTKPTARRRGAGGERVVSSRGGGGPGACIGDDGRRRRRRWGAARSSPRTSHSPELLTGFGGVSCYGVGFGFLCSISFFSLPPRKKGGWFGSPVSLFFLRVVGVPRLQYGTQGLDEPMSSSFRSIDGLCRVGDEGRGCQSPVATLGWPDDVAVARRASNRLLRRQYPV